MAIQGAIFDCDGTLLDTMIMWRGATNELLGRLGLPQTRALFDEIEPLSLHDTCTYLHEHYHVGESSEAIFAMLDEIVRAGYERTARPLPGILDLLESFKAHGVKMCVASSTAQKNLNYALKIAGIDHYFEKTFSTGGTIRSKEYPDIWKLAHEFLGTPDEATWVFEDTPFGVREGQAAGLKTVCFFDTRLARDEVACRKYSDIFVHSPAEVSYELISDYERGDCSCKAEAASYVADDTLADGVREATGAATGTAAGADTGAATLSALIVGASRDDAPHPDLVRALCAEADYVIAADGGLDTLMAADMMPHIYCGDADSAEQAHIERMKAQGVSHIMFPRDKYASDLSLAVDAACNEARRQHKQLRLSFTGISGGRADLNLISMGVVAHAFRYCPRIVENSYVARVLSPQACTSWEIKQPRARVSVIALAPKTCVSEQGMKWELDHEMLSLLGDMGISNEISKDVATITCHKGVAYVYCERA